MVRCVLGPEGDAIVSRTAAGRGAWLCAATCFATAVKRKGFERAWRRPVPVGALDELQHQISNAFESTATQMREWTAVGSASDVPTPTKG